MGLVTKLDQLDGSFEELAFREAGWDAVRDSYYSNASMLVDAFQRDIDLRQEGRILHGTCLEALDVVLEKGIVASTTQIDATGCTLGHLYGVASNEEYLRSAIERIEGLEVDETIEEALKVYDECPEQIFSIVQGYGSDQAKYEYLLSRLQLERNSGNSYFVDLLYNTAFPRNGSNTKYSLEALCKGQKFDSEMARLICAKARQRKGIVLAFKPEVQDLYTFSQGDDWRIQDMRTYWRGGQVRVHIPDIRIAVGEGLPIELIDGIQVLGDEEFDFFETLQELVEAV